MFRFSSLILAFSFGLCPTLGFADYQDHYAILGLKEKASIDEINSAFRKLVMVYHPDKSSGDREKFQQLMTAYKTLSDPEKRAQYDQESNGPGDDSQLSRAQWTNHFSEQQEKMRTADPFYVRHPLALFYASVIRQNFHYWHPIEEKEGIANGRAWKILGSTYAMAVQIQFQSLARSQNWTMAENFFTLSRPDLIQLILTTQPSSSNLDFAVELIHSADAQKGARVDSEKMAQMALQLVNSNYFRNTEIRKRIEKPLRKYLKKEFFSKENPKNHIPGKLEARKFLNMTSIFGRPLSNCSKYLRPN